MTGLMLYGPAGMWSLSSPRAIIPDEETNGKLQLLYSHVSPAMSSIVHFDYNGINPPFISLKKKKLLVKGWPRLNLVNFLFGYFPMDTLLFTCYHTKFWEFNGFVGCDLWKLWDLLLEAKSKYTINAIHKCAVNNMYNCTWWPWMIYLLVSLRELSMCNTAPSSYLRISDLPFCREILYVINYTREPFISWRPADF